MDAWTPELSPELLVVSPAAASSGRGDDAGRYGSLTAALAACTSGDTVRVGPGVYGPTTTGERLPLYVPPGVTLLGAGRGRTVLDGEGAFEATWRPVREDQSLLVLGDGCTLGGFTVRNSGGNAVAARNGASVCVTDNELTGNGQHGLFLAGAGHARVRRNVFSDNGTKRHHAVTYRRSPARPGHHVFAVLRAGVTNLVDISDNRMERACCDAVAVITEFDDPRPFTARVAVTHNVIAGAERHGLLLAGSFGQPEASVVYEVLGNEMSGIGAIGVLCGAAYPMVRRLATGVRMRLTMVGNVVHDAGDGVNLWGGFGPASGTLLDATLADNRFGALRGYGIRAIAGLGGARGDSASGNRVHVTAIANSFASVGKDAVLAQGASLEGPDGGVVVDNHVRLTLRDNAFPEDAPITLNDGPASNSATMNAPAPEHRRVDGLVPFP